MFICHRTGNTAFYPDISGENHNLGAGQSVQGCLLANVFTQWHL